MKTVEGLQNGDKKECPKCKNIRNLDDFKDSSLITGYGRFCNFCKGIKVSKKVISYDVIKGDDRSCPKCASKMSLRNGRYGKFYGCSNYPYCKGTRNVS